MKALQAVSLILGIIVSALTIAEKNGVWLPPVVAFVNEQSAWLLPLICIVFGVAAGWNAKKWSASGSGGPKKLTQEKIETAQATNVKLNGLSDLLPAEKEMLSRLYNEVQVHVGMDGLATARALRARGAVRRTDAPESDVISQCYVELTDEWRGIVKTAMEDC